MSLPTPLTDLAEQIADYVEPDWDSLPDDSDDVAGFKLLYEIASSFLRPGDDADPEPALFRWRHLDVLEPLGAGAFGQVYRAHDSVLKREVALKLEHDREGPSTGPDMVIAEARAMARVRHPNILAVHGADVVEGRVGIWSDLLHGRTLDAILDEVESLPVGDVITLALPLAEALALIHQRGLVHGDVKPGNVMIQSDGSPILMDLGAARESGRRHATTLGSPRFMAPEQFDGSETSPASDLFAFGVMLFRALAGHFPWSADSLASLEAIYAAKKAPSLGGVPRRFRGLLGEMLSYSPSRRPTAESLVARLDALRDAPQRLRKRLAVGAVIGSLLVGLVAAIDAYQSEQRGRERAQALRDLVTGALQAADPMRTSGPTSVKVIYDYIAERMDEALLEDPPALAEMRLMVGEGLGRLGEPEVAAEILERTLADLDPESEVHTRRRSLAWLSLVDQRMELGDLAGAEVAIRAAITETERRTDPDGPAQVLVAQNKLMMLLGLQGRWAEQIEVQEALLAARQELHGEDSLATAVDHHNLATVYQKVGRFDDALPHEQRAGELLQANGDEGSLRLGYVWLAVASIRMDLGDLDEAERFLDRAAELYRANLPAEHSGFREIESEQARLWRLAGDFARAEALLLEHVKLDEPESEFYRVGALRNLAYIRFADERWDDARALLAEHNASLPPAMIPLEAYYAAALSYADARGAVDEHEQAAATAVAAIDEALADLSERELTRTEYYTKLEAWREALVEAGDPSRQAGPLMEQVPTH